MKQKTGLVIFFFGVVWSLVWGIIISIPCTTAINSMTMEQLNESAWTLSGPLMLLWGVGGVPLGVVFSGIGLFLYTDAKGFTTLIFSIGILLAIFLAMSTGALGFYPPLFGIGGTIILLSFFGILWFWAKGRKEITGQWAKAADLRLVGYVFLLIATWFTCGLGGQLMGKAFEGFDHPPPLHILIFFVLGWLFVFLSHNQVRKEKISEGI